MASSRYPMVRAVIHLISEGSCTVYTVEKRADSDDWAAVDQLLNRGRAFPERPQGEKCEGYHIYVDRGLVHDRC